MMTLISLKNYGLLPVWETYQMYQKINPKIVWEHLNSLYPLWQSHRRVVVDQRVLKGMVTAVLLFSSIHSRIDDFRN